MKIYKNIYIFTFFFKNMEPFANLHVFLVQEPTWRAFEEFKLARYTVTFPFLQKSLWMPYEKLFRDARLESQENSSEAAAETS